VSPEANGATLGEIIAESQRKSQDLTPDIRTGLSDQSLGQPSTGDAGIASVTPGAGSPKIGFVSAAGGAGSRPRSLTARSGRK